MAIKITINKAAAGGADVEEVEEVRLLFVLRLTRRLMEISSLKIIYDGHCCDPGGE